MWRSADVLFETFEEEFKVWDRADIEGRMAREAKDEAVAPADLSRDDLIRWYWAHRWTMREISEEVGISRQRVHQILTREGRGKH